MGIERMGFSDFGPRYYEHVDPNISNINASCIVFLKFMHLHCCISFIATLDVQRGDVKHVITEPNHNTVLGGRILKREGPAGSTKDPAQSQKGPRPC